VLAEGPDGCPTLAFTPDFLLPAFGCYLEVTTLEQRHVTRKNRKARLLRERHPDIDVRIIYQRDYHHLIVKYGLAPPEQHVARDGGRGAGLVGGGAGSRDPGHADRRGLSDLGHSPLDGAHRALGAKMVPFGGWEMPLSYPAGTLAEHRACRTGAVAFDVSHLGTVRVVGPDAFDRLQSTLTADLSKISAGRTQYTHLLDEADGSVQDDIIVWWVSDERFDVMPNASNTSRVVDAIGGVDVTGERAVIALQGPQARARLEGLVTLVDRRRVAEAEWDGVPV